MARSRGHRVIIGAVGVGALVASVVATHLVRSVTVWVLAEQTLAEQRLEIGNLVPIVVTDRELAPGQTLTYDVIAQRTVPEHLVSQSWLAPESVADMIGTPTLARIPGGGPLTRGDVPPQVLESCAWVQAAREDWEKRCEGHGGWVPGVTSGEEDLTTWHQCADERSAP